MSPTEALAAAMRHHQAGQLADAERLYAQVLAAEPAHLQALVMSGALAHMSGRNEQAAGLFERAIAVSEQPDFHFNAGLAKWMLDRKAEATVHWSRAITLNPNFAPAHMNLGNALREEGRLDEAVTHLRQALQLQPSPFAHNNLGLALAARGDPQAATHYRRAIEMHPAFTEPYLNLALETARKGDIAQALALVRRALAIAETPESKALFVRLAAALDAVADDAGLRQLVTRAVTEKWERFGHLAPLVATLVKHGGNIECDPLLPWLLTSGVICDLDLEKTLTAMRRALTAISPEAMSEDQLPLVCALAQQCFINEYVYAADSDELIRLRSLRESLIAAASIGGAVTPGLIAAVACYGPLYALSMADALLRRSWPEPVAALVDQQIRAPRAEADARAAIPRLTPIEDDVSLQVQQQYEQNPYPRWIALDAVPPAASIDAMIRQALPHAPYRGGLARRDPDILIAGCGTGRQSVSVAHEFPNGKILAIDLSAASLGYAKARTGALGVTNIEYAQADILRLGSLGRAFDMIQVGGVLHHLAEPWAGWRELLALLRPGGVMYVALYSELARRDVVAARAFIAQRGYGASADDIRACRQALMAQADEALRNVARFNDFFTTSECRDLLFHVQEHRMTLPAIKDFLDANRLAFLGFSLEPVMLTRYAARFPDDRAMTNLDNWHAFEQDNPYTFASMYRFWIQKAD